MMLSTQKLMLAFLFLAMPMTNSLYAHFEHPSPDMYFSVLAFSSRGADPELSITIQVLQNANCNQNGIILAQAKNGIAPYEYQIVAALPSGNFSVPPPPPTPTGSWNTSNTFNVAAGTYVVFARDQLGIVVSLIQTVTKNPNPTIQLTVVNPCASEGKFELKIEATTPGTLPYILSRNGASFETVSLPHTFFNQYSGDYNIKIQDSTACESSQTITIYPPLVLSIQSVTQPNCNSNNGSVALATKGGSSNFEYQINGSQTTTDPVFTGLSSGIYRFRVDDKSTGCFEEIDVSIASPIAGTGLQFVSTEVSCHGGNDGGIRIHTDSAVSTTANSSGYSYSIDNINFQEAPHFSGLKAGIYTVQAALNNYPGCIITHKISVIEPEPLIANLTLITPLNCGILPEMELVVSGGTSGYSYSRDGAIFSNPLLDTPQKINAGIGSYKVYVKDAKGCSVISNDIIIDTIPGLIVELDTSLAKIKCNGDTTATITALALGGLGSYRYSLLDDIGNTIKPFQPSGVFTHLGPGTYIVKAESADCTPAMSKRIIIDEVEPLQLSLKEGGLNEIIAVPKGGSGNYKFTFEGEYYDDIPSYYYFNTQDYLVTVQDANGCTAAITQQFKYTDICPPNFFTPNGDGINDTWAPGCAVNYNNLTFFILDRQGVTLGAFRFGQSWDGTYQGALLPAGDYWYILKLNNSKDEREFVGHFTLYR